MNSSIRSNQQRQSDIDQQTGADLSFRVKRRKTKSNKLSFLTLTAIVMIYIVCNIPRLFLNLVDYWFEAFEDFDFCNCKFNPFWLIFSVLVSHLLLVINSAINCIIYLSVYKSFKTVFLVKLGVVRQHRPRPARQGTIDKCPNILINGVAIDWIMYYSSLVTKYSTTEGDQHYNTMSTLPDQNTISDWASPQCSIWGGM